MKDDVALTPGGKINRPQRCVPDLVYNDTVCSSDREKADIFVDVFSSLSQVPDTPDRSSERPTPTCPNKFSLPFVGK